MPEKSWQLHSHKLHHHELERYDMVSPVNREQKETFSRCPWDSNPEPLPIIIISMINRKVARCHCARAPPLMLSLWIDVRVLSDLRGGHHQWVMIFFFSLNMILWKLDGWHCKDEIREINEEFGWMWMVPYLVQTPYPFGYR